MKYEDPDIQRQYDEWVNSPDAKSQNIDDDTMRNKLMEDLAYVSTMDVKEYTLYQKWQEVQYKFPVEKKQTVFGDEEVFFKKPHQKDVIEKVKNNLWIPENPDDFQNLKPVLEFTDDSTEIEHIGIDGSTVTTDIKRNQELPETWTALGTFTTNLRNNSNIGRNLKYLVKDDVTGKYLGSICMSSDFLNMKPRDDEIGWDNKLKTGSRDVKGMISYTSIGSTIVPVQPFGYNYVGGKLLALLTLSDEVQNRWKECYGDRLVGVTTTSLYGSIKPGGLSQYDGLEHWNKMGFTAGSVCYDVSPQVQKMMQEWAKSNYPDKYFQWWVAKGPSGAPWKRDHRTRFRNFAYSKLKMPKDYTESKHGRGIYFAPLYDNTYEFLRGEISENELVKSIDTSTETLVDIWKKHAKGRIRFLQKKNRISTESLFYDDLVYLTWEETKEKYLSNIGR